MSQSADTTGLLMLFVFQTEAEEVEEEPGAGVPAGREKPGPGERRAWVAWAAPGCWRAGREG